MKKMSSFIKAMALAMVMMISLVLLGCSKTPKFQITWTIPEHASVKVEGMEELPKEMEENSEVVFTITLDGGYKVKSVKANNKRLPKKSDKYSTKITKDTEIKIEVEKAVAGIEVTHKPTKLSYFAGEALDPAGMEVKVKYEDNTEAVLEKGRDGYSVSPSTFEGGETSFKVIFDDFEEEVALDSKVEYLVKIDPKGGVIADSWVQGLRNMNLKNVEVLENGTVTFSYFDNILAPITLPTKEEVTYENYTFLGWNNNTEITNATRANVACEANWQAELVDIENVEIVMENDKPLLVVHGKFKLADEVYLYLYEGNVDLGIKGDTYTNTSGVGSTFKTVFDLTKLVEYQSEDGATLEGKWMDLRFNASIDGKDESMEIFIGEGSAVEHDLNQKLQTTDYTYCFAEYNNFIKVYYTANNYTYNVSFKSENNTDYLVISGKANTKYAGKNIQVSWWFGQEEPKDSSVIAADGSFEILVDLKDIPVKNHGWAHVTIYDEDPESPIFGSVNTNLAISQCLTPLEEVKIEGTGIHRAVKYVNAQGVSFYAGTENDGLMLYQIDESRSLNCNKFDLELKDGAVYYVLSGSYKGYTLDELKLFFDMENHGDNGQTGIFTEKSAAIMEVNEEAKTFVAKFNATALAAQEFKDSASDKWEFFIHWGFEGDTKLGDVKDIVPNNRIITLNGIKYSLKNGDGTWGMTNLVMEKSQDSDSELFLEYKSGVITEVDGRAILTITGEASGYNVDYFIMMKLQLNGIFNNDSNWDVTELTPEVKLDGKVLTIKIDVTDLAAGGYITKIQTTDTEMTDLKISESVDQKISVGNKHFTLVGVPGSGDPKLFWGCLGVVVANINEA